MRRFILTPAGLMNMFVPAGAYEGRNILRMRKHTLGRRGTAT